MGVVLRLWQGPQPDPLSAARLPTNPKGTRWDQVLFVLVADRLLWPDSELRQHRQWFERSALADLLGVDARLADTHKLHARHDRLLAPKRAAFDHLVGRRRNPGNVETCPAAEQMKSAGPCRAPHPDSPSCASR